jgi:hypothetical protein
MSLTCKTVGLSERVTMYMEPTFTASEAYPDPAVEYWSQRFSACTLRLSVLPRLEARGIPTTRLCLLLYHQGRITHARNFVPGNPASETPVAPQDVADTP